MSDTKRVLIVEDRKDFQKIFAEIVAGLGYHSQTAATLKEGLAALDRATFHVALVDLRLDDEDKDNWDGFQILERITALDEGTRPIVLTAFGEVEDSSEAFRKHHVFDFIRKQKVDIPEVMDKIRQAADQASQEMARPARLPDLTSLIKGISPKQILGQFEANFEELEFFFRRLLNELQPVLPDKKPAETYVGPGIKSSLRVRFWSKGLVGPVVVWLGNRDEIEKAIRDVDRSAAVMQKMGYGRKIQEVFGAPEPSSPHLPKPSITHLGGAVYTLIDVPFEEFESKS